MFDENGKYIEETTEAEVKEAEVIEEVKSEPLFTNDFEAGFEKECDFTVALLASPELRLSRLTLRDNRTAEALKARMNAAPADEFYSSRATYTIINDGDADKLREAAKNILK